MLSAIFLYVLEFFFNFSISYLCFLATGHITFSLKLNSFQTDQSNTQKGLLEKLTTLQEESRHTETLECRLFEYRNDITIAYISLSPIPLHITAISAKFLVKT